MVARSITLLVTLAFMWQSAAAARAELLPAYKLEISNAYIGLLGESPRSTPSFFGGGSVLQQLVESSKPYVRITNVSIDPKVKLIGAQLNLADSGSIITACEWISGVTDPKPGWNWNAEKASAFFQFHKPLGPGETILMRLSTAPRPGMEMQYKQNQTLFHPAIGNCVDSSLNYATVELFSQPLASVQPPSYDPSGAPQAPDKITSVTPLDTPLTPSQIENPSSVVITPVPVPEPDTIVLAASAAAMLAFAARRSVVRQQAAA